jgi:TonB family protein
MYGDDRVRFCGRCSQNVYNLSSMTREEAQDMIRRTDGQLCVRFYRRRDGTVLTRNCPVGLRAIKARLTGTAAILIRGLLMVLACIGGLWWRTRGNDDYGVLPVTIAPRSRVQAYVTGMLVRPTTGVDTFRRSEAFIRDRAILQVTPGRDAAGTGRTKPVVVRIVITEDGEVDEAILVKGDESLRDLAEDAASRWRFKPVLARGVRIRVESSLTFRFRR